MPTPRSQRGGANPTAKTTGRGWDAAAAKKASNEEARKNQGNQTYDLTLKDGQYTIVQFLEEEPLCLEVHNLKIDGKWKTIPCQKASKRGCTLCEDGIKTAWKAAFLVLDFRGEWDKEKGRFKNTDTKGKVIPDKTPVERRLLASNQLALVIKAEKEKKDTITKFQYELSRTGATARDTSYQISRALDDDDRPMRSIEWDMKGDIEALCKPPTDEQLAKMGYDGSSTQDDDDTPPARPARRVSRDEED
jgi:hypothetical protein